MAGIFGGTMNTSSSSEAIASAFQSSGDGVKEGVAGGSPSVNQQDQVASVSYAAPTVDRSKDQGEHSIALPIFTPKNTMDFRKWATEGYNADGPTLSGPKGEIDYDHEPGYGSYPV